jgi:hypothetical protein
MANAMLHYCFTVDFARFRSGLFTRVQAETLLKVVEARLLFAFFCAYIDGHTVTKSR